MFRLPKERGRRCDERGRWRGIERFDADGGGEAAETKEAWETSGEEEAEEDAANLERSVEDADRGDDGEETAPGIGDAEPGEADIAGGASQAVAEGSWSRRPESRRRDASHQDEHYAERSGGGRGTAGVRGKIAHSTSAKHKGAGAKTAQDRRTGSRCAREDGRASHAPPATTGGGKKDARRGPVHQRGAAGGKRSAAGRHGRPARKRNGRGGWAADSARRSSGSSEEEKAAETGARPEIIGSKGGEKHGNRRQRGSGSERQAQWGGERHESRRHEREGVQKRRGAREAR
ncbi:unnamed protein product [Closterium sp. NIES-65]|nr:unnamed protein product [Closterium sp. NIES-65]